MLEKSNCRICKHYIESTDYCEIGLFELEEKVMEDCADKEPEDELMNGCIFYEWNGK